MNNFAVGLLLGFIVGFYEAFFLIKFIYNPIIPYSKRVFIGITVAFTVFLAIIGSGWLFARLGYKGNAFDEALFTMLFTMLGPIIYAIWKLKRGKTYDYRIHAYCNKLDDRDEKNAGPP